MFNKIKPWILCSNSGHMHIMFICFLVVLGIIAYLILTKVSPETAWQIKNGILLK